MSPATPLHLFVHLQKTGGTALLRRLRHHFGSDAVFPPPEEQGTPEAVLDVDNLLARLDHLGDRVQVVTGHFPLCVADILGDHVIPFTILRDPVERTLSFLRHQREVEPRFATASLEQVYDDPVSTGGLVANHMVKMLSLTSTEMTAGALTPLHLDDGHVARAQQNLVERVEVVGLQEHFDVLCADLEARFTWDLGPPVFMNRTTPTAAPEPLRERIRADNAYDVALYAFARSLWGQRHPSVPPLAPPAG